MPVARRIWLPLRLPSIGKRCDSEDDMFPKRSAGVLSSDFPTHFEFRNSVCDKSRLGAAPVRPCYWSVQRKRRARRGQQLPASGRFESDWLEFDAVPRGVSDVMPKRGGKRPSVDGFIQV